MPAEAWCKWLPQHQTNLDKECCCSKGHAVITSQNHTVRRSTCPFLKEVPGLEKCGFLHKSSLGMTFIDAVIKKKSVEGRGPEVLTNR